MITTALEILSSMFVVAITVTVYTVVRNEPFGSHKLTIVAILSLMATLIIGVMLSL